MAQMMVVTLATLLLVAGVGKASEEFATEKTEYIAETYGIYFDDNVSGGSMDITITE